MRHIIEQLVASNQSLGLGGSSRFYVDDSRLQRNLQRVIACPSLTSAALTGVITDHRVVETLVKTDPVALRMVLQLEAKLGRKLGRERAQKLMAAYNKVRAAKLRQVPSKSVVYPAVYLAA